MKYFLAVSLIPQTIDRDAEKILYIEDGCLKDRRNTENYLVLDKPLKDAKEVLDAFRETDNAYEKMLEVLTEALNNFHQINFDKKVWRIILFEWLSYYTEAIYHKLINVNAAIEYGSVYSYVLDKKSYKHPYFWRGFWMWGLREEAYNFQLYSNVLNFKEIEIKKSVVLEAAPTSPKKSGVKKKKTLKQSLQSLAHKAINHISHKSETIIINPQNFGFGIKELLNLAVRSNFKIGFFYPDEIKINVAEYDEDVRNMIRLESDSTYDSELKKILSMYVIQDIPTMYLEGFQDGFGLIKDFQCKKVISAEDYSEDYRASMLMAATKSRNGKIFLVQIGGDADILLGKTEAYLDAKMTDVLYSGGWTNSNYPCEIRRLTNPRYWRARNAVKEVKKKYDIMYVGTAISAYRLVLGLASNLWPKEYVNDNIELIAHLVEDRGYKVKVRFFLLNEGWHMEERLKERLRECGKTVELDENKNRFIDSVQECKICIVSSIETVWAETLNMDIPLIIFIPKYLEYFSERGWELVNKMKTIGIYFNTYSEIIHCLDQIDDVDRWWKEKQPVIQQIKNQYCWCADDPQKEWMEEFINISKE